MDIIVAHDFYKQAGGEDQCVSSEIALLRAHGHTVTQFFLRNDSIDGMSRLAVASQTIWSWPAYRELRELIRAHRPQIVHFHNTFPLISPAAYYAAKAEGVAVVQTLHNFRLLCANALLYRDGHVCEDCLGKSVPWPGVLHGCYRDSRAASATVAAMLMTHNAMGTWRNAVDTYIALTDFSRRKLVESGIPAAKVAVKPNFLNTDPGAGAGKGGYGLFVGRLSREKGVATLLEAWRHLQGRFPLKILGDGPLASLVREAAAQDPMIEWLGSRPIEEVLERIGEAAFLVAPSQWYENFPRVFVEAFAKGTPVIATRLGAMPDIVKDGGTGLLFQPNDASDLALKVRQIVADPSTLSKLRKDARQAFVDNLTAATNHKLLMAIYKQALQPASGGLFAREGAGERIGRII
jgi:glycosyltransferase involved in cell wall biosynthesis